MSKRFTVINLNSGRAFSSGSGSGSALTVQDEGVNVDTNVTVINFIGADVQALAGGAGTVQVYIPPPAFASHWNQTNGTTTGTVNSTVTTSTARISEPTSEGNPFSVGSTGNTNHAASQTDTGTFAPTAGQLITGLGGNATFNVKVFDANGSSTLENFTTAAITGNGTYSSPSGLIIVTVSSYAADTTRFKGYVSVEIQVNNILSGAGRTGGLYSVTITQNTDTTTDGTGPYTYTQASVFLDKGSSPPTITGTTTVAEGTLTTKHLSGVEYYTTGSKFTVNVQDINNLNLNTARTTQNLQVINTGYGVSTPLNQSPFGTGSSNFTGWTIAYNNTGADYSNTSYNVNRSTYRFVGTTANVSGRARDTWGNSSYVASSNASHLVDTFPTSSTNTLENFDDEARRQTSTYNGGSTSGNWTSTNSLVASEAMVYRGRLIVPSQAQLGEDIGASSSYGSVNPNLSTFKPDSGGANPNYSSLNAPVSYFRSFVDTSGNDRSSMTITFTGTFISDAVTDLAAENLKMFVRRIASANGGNTGTSAPALIVHGGLYNAAVFDDGATNGNIRTGGSGNTVQATFGGFSCNDGFYCELQIANAGIKISSIEITFIG